MNHLRYLGDSPIIFFGSTTATGTIMLKMKRYWPKMVGTVNAPEPVFHYRFSPK